MKFAYLIMAHNEFSILEKLLYLLDDDRNDIYLHIDRKAQAIPKSILDGSILNKSALHIVQQHDVRWGGYSQISCALDLLFSALKEGEKYDYYHLISGVDLPLHNQDYIHNFFSLHCGKEFVGIDNKWVDNKSVQHRFQVYHLFQDKVGRNKTALYYLNRVIAKLQVPFVHRRNEIMSGGPCWFSITDSFARYIYSQRKWIEKSFKYTVCGDEHYIQTIMINSTFIRNHYLPGETMYKQCLRYVDFYNSGDSPGSPKTLEIEDVIELVNSKQYIFARKFSTSSDRRSEAVNFLFEELCKEKNVK